MSGRQSSRRVSDTFRVCNHKECIMHQLSRADVEAKGITMIQTYNCCGSKVTLHCTATHGFLCSCKEELEKFGCDFDACVEFFVSKCNTCFKCFCDQHFSNDAHDLCQICSGEPVKKKKKTATTKKKHEESENFVNSNHDDKNEKMVDLVESDTTYVNDDDDDKNEEVVVDLESDTHVNDNNDKNEEVVDLESDTFVNCDVESHHDEMEEGVLQSSSNAAAVHSDDDMYEEEEVVEEVQRQEELETLNNNNETNEEVEEAQLNDTATSVDDNDDKNEEVVQRQNDSTENVQQLSETPPSMNGDPELDDIPEKWKKGMNKNVLDFCLNQRQCLLSDESGEVKKRFDDYKNILSSFRWKNSRYKETYFATFGGLIAGCVERDVVQVFTKAPRFCYEEMLNEPDANGSCVAVKIIQSQDRFYMLSDMGQELSVIFIGATYHKTKDYVLHFYNETCNDFLRSSPHTIIKLLHHPPSVFFKRIDNTSAAVPTDSSELFEKIKEYFKQNESTLTDKSPVFKMITNSRHFRLKIEENQKLYEEKARVEKEKQDAALRKLERMEAKREKEQSAQEELSKKLIGNLEKKVKKVTAENIQLRNNNERTNLVKESLTMPRNPGNLIQQQRQQLTQPPGNGNNLPDARSVFQRQVISVPNFQNEPQVQQQQFLQPTEPNVQLEEEQAQQPTPTNNQVNPRQHQAKEQQSTPTNNQHPQQHQAKAQQPTPTYAQLHPQQQQAKEQQPTPTSNQLDPRQQQAKEQQSTPMSNQLDTQQEQVAKQSLQNPFFLQQQQGQYQFSNFPNAQQSPQQLQYPFQSSNVPQPPPPQPQFYQFASPNVPPAPQWHYVQSQQQLQSAFNIPPNAHYGFPHPQQFSNYQGSVEHSSSQQGANNPYISKEAAFEITRVALDRQRLKDLEKKLTDDDIRKSLGLH